MSKAMSDDITYCLQCVVFPILTAFGLLGNTLSLIVLFQKKIRNSTTSIVLIGLAISDVCFLVTNMARKSTCIIRQFDKLTADTFNAVSFGGLFFTKTAFSRVSTLIVVLISIERLFAVAFPLKVRSLVTKTRMTVAVITCFIIPFAFCAGLPPQYTYTYIRGRPYIAQTKFALENADPLKIYNEYFLVISLRYIPVIVVIILNTLIIVLFKRSRRFQNKNAGNSERELARQQEERKLTRMLLAVAIIFLICLLPGDAVLLISGINAKFSFFGTYHNFFLAISDLSLLFEIMNSSINFIIYMLLNRLFFETYNNLFCKCIKGRFGNDSKYSKTKTKSNDTGTTSEKKNVEKVESIKKDLGDYGIEVSCVDENIISMEVGCESTKNISMDPNGLKSNDGGKGEVDAKKDLSTQHI